MQRVYLEQVAPLLNQSQITQLQIIIAFSDVMTTGARTSKDFVKIAVLVSASDAPLASIEITTSSTLMNLINLISKTRLVFLTTRLICWRKKQKPCLTAPKILKLTSSSYQTSQCVSEKSRRDSGEECTRSWLWENWNETTYKSKTCTTSYRERRRRTRIWPRDLLNLTCAPTAQYSTTLETW